MKSFLKTHRKAIQGIDLLLLILLPLLLYWAMQSGSPIIPFIILVVMAACMALVIWVG